jgi:hypothetical protein
MRWPSISIVVISIVLWVLPAIGQSRKPSSNLLTASQKVEVGEALRALRQIVSITKVGVNRQEYGPRVLDMAATVDESVRNIPDSELKKHILGAKEMYVSVKNFWANDRGFEDLSGKMVQLSWEAGELLVKEADTLFQAGRLNR